MGISPAEISILLVDNRQIQSLNRTWRGKNRPTDVLSFAQREGKFADPQDPVLGDIVISLEKAREQAREQGHSLEHELNILLVHGLLHLLGCEHTRGGAEARRMRSQEQKLLAILEK